MYHKLQDNNVPAELDLKSMSAHHLVPDITEMDMWFR